VIILGNLGEVDQTKDQQVEVLGGPALLGGVLRRVLVVVMADRLRYHCFGSAVHLPI